MKVGVNQISPFGKENGERYGSGVAGVAAQMLGSVWRILRALCNLGSESSFAEL
jgi:hypothetical protein